MGLCFGQLFTVNIGTMILLYILGLLSVTTGSQVTYDYDTIVVGAGAAGIATASPLARAGRRVLALEAQDRIGGRVWTEPFGDSVVELGAEWIEGTVNSSVYALAKRFKVPTVSQNISIFSYRSDGSKGNTKIMKESIDLAYALTYNPSNPPEKLGDLIVRKVTDYLRENHAEVLNDHDFMTELLNLLNLFVLMYESADSWNDVTTDNSYRPLGGNPAMSWGSHGYKTLFEILLYRYENRPGIPLLTIKPHSPVKKVTWANEGGGVSVETIDGKTFTAENVVVTVSVGVLKEKHSELFSPSLPKEKIDAINQIGYGVCDKIALRFNEDWWNGNSYGFIWKGEDRKKISEEDTWVTRISGIFPPVSPEKTVFVWFCGEAARKLESLPDNVVTNKIMEVIKKFLEKDFNIPDPVEMKRSSWYTNPYTRGSYSYDNLEYPLHPDIRATLGEPLADSNGVNRVLFAGEATMVNWYSTVHGAVESGYREAARILGVDLSKEPRTWADVNN